MAFECSSAPDAAVICHRTLSPNFRIRLRTDDICLRVSTSHNFETVPFVPGQMGSTVQHMWN